MSYRDAVVLLTGRAARGFGTGFIIAHDSQGALVVTCAHVLQAAGNVEQLVVNYELERAATLVASGADKGIDLTVIRVPGLADRPALQLAPDGAAGLSVIISGYRKHDPTSHIHRDLHAVLGGLVGLHWPSYPTAMRAWDLSLQGEYGLDDGYSGAPVIDPATNLVVAVASKLERQGRAGQAIDVGLLAQFWQQMPPGTLLQRRTSASDATAPRQPADVSSASAVPRPRTSQVISATGGAKVRGATQVASLGAQQEMSAQRQAEIRNVRQRAHDASEQRIVADDGGLIEGASQTADEGEEQ